MLNVKFNKKNIKKSLKKYGALALLSLAIGVAPIMCQSNNANASMINMTQNTFIAPTAKLSQIKKQVPVKIIQKDNNTVIYQIVTNNTKKINKVTKKVHAHKIHKHVHKHNHKHSIKLGSANNQPNVKNKKLGKIQSRNQKKVNAKLIRKHAKKNNIDNGLTQADKIARAKVVYQESRGEWNVSNGRCYGRFQLLPGYLGYVHGHLNLNHKHQIKTANAYVAHRYGNWVNAWHFHESHNWY